MFILVLRNDIRFFVGMVKIILYKRGFYKIIACWIVYIYGESEASRGMGKNHDKSALYFEGGASFPVSFSQEIEEVKEEKASSDVNSQMESSPLYVEKKQEAGREVKEDAEQVGELHGDGVSQWGVLMRLRTY